MNGMLLVSRGEFLAKKGNIGRTTIFNQLGVSRQEVTRATRLYQFQEAVKDCTSVVSDLQVCSTESNRIRTASQKLSTVKALTPDELEAKRVKDLKENEDYNSHRAMTAL